MPVAAQDRPQPEILSASYYRARYYDPNVGRFLSEDPLRFTSTVNFYLYTSNQPIRYSDPLGLSGQDVQRILAGCKKCTDQLTASGERRSGSGERNGLLNNFISSITLGHKYSGCDRLANLTAGCLDAPVPPYDDHWDFMPISVSYGFHRVTMGFSKNPSDPIVVCDSWAGTSTTIPRGVGGGGGGPF
jgi:RHS repeat-associated protein